jgi:hypothetical protein
MAQCGRAIPPCGKSRALLRPRPFAHCGSPGSTVSLDCLAKTRGTKYETIETVLTFGKSGSIAAGLATAGSHAFRLVESLEIG